MNNWYILLYHNVSWEHGPFTEYCTSTCPPDLFREQLNTLTSSFRIVSLEDGWRQFKSGTQSEDLLTIWFDDGMRGVREFAFPIMSEFSVKGAVSVCSEFWRQKKYFWRFQLGFLRRIDGLRFLRTKLRPLGYKNEYSVKNFTLDHFGPAVLEAIDHCFERFADEATKAAAFKLFDDKAGLIELRNAGWTLTNHSASHFPIGEPTAIDDLNQEFELCELAMNEDFGLSNEFYVLPFAREEKNSKDLKIRFRTKFPGATLVLAGDRGNNFRNLDDGVIYRHTAPLLRGRELLKFLKR
jgi:hypothetical protein